MQNCLFIVRVFFILFFISTSAHAQVDAKKASPLSQPSQNDQKANDEESSQFETSAPVSEQVKKLEEEDDSVLQRHQPFYFAYGEPFTKVQFSFKTPFVRRVPVYFAYTQVMFWALKEDSRPFRDLTYNPEVFYRWRDNDWSTLESVDFGFWNHNSNGKNELESRSYEKQYVRANFAFEGHRWVTRFSTELAYLNNLDKTNRDLREYIGPAIFYLSFIQTFDSYIDKSEIIFKASPGGKLAQEWDQGGYQISWSFRLGKLKIVPAFYMQYYRGFAESLLNYNKDVDEFRGGVIF